MNIRLAIGALGALILAGHLPASPLENPTALGPLPEVRQMVAEESAVYILTESRSVYRVNHGVVDRLGPPTVATREVRCIAADGSSVLALVDPGEVWRFGGGEWTRIARRPGLIHMISNRKATYLADGEGRVFRLRRKRGPLSLKGPLQKVGVFPGLRALAERYLDEFYVLADDLYRIPNSKDVWRVRSGAGMVDVVGRHALTFCFYQNGELWRDQHGYTEVTPKPDTVEIAFTWGRLYFRDSAGNVWYRRDGGPREPGMAGWKEVPGGRDVVAMVPTEKELYTVTRDGVLHRWQLDQPLSRSAGRRERFQQLHQP